MDETKKLWLWLTAREGMNVSRVYHLIQKFGRPEAVYEASPEQYEGIRQIGPETIELLKNKDLSFLGSLEEKLERHGIRVITVDDPEYPARLREIDAYPYVLYFAGQNVELDRSLTVGIIGSRKATPYGVECASKLSMDLTQAGAMIVSGMAEGIDGAANLGALKAGGQTVAILGCGLDIAYPAMHKELMLHIKKRGLLISEYPPGSRPLRYHFPERNRIISGLSEAIVIVEAKMKSGTKITGDLALEQGKDVFVVPGSIFSPNSEGTLDYLKQGARPLTCAKDILDEYAFKYQLESMEAVPTHPGDAEKIEDKNKDIIHIIDTDERYSGLSDEDKAVLKCLSHEPVGFDLICQRLAIPAQELNAKLSILTIQGLVVQHPFSRFSLAESSLEEK